MRASCTSRPAGWGRPERHLYARVTDTPSPLCRDTIHRVVAMGKGESMVCVWQEQIDLLEDSLQMLLCQSHALRVRTGLRAVASVLYPPNSVRTFEHL